MDFEKRPGILLSIRMQADTALHAVRLMLSESRMMQEVTYGLMWQLSPRLNRRLLAIKKLRHEFLLIFMAEKMKG